MTPDDIAVVRRIITARRRLGWHHPAVFGGRLGHEHLYWAPGDFRYSAKVIVGANLIEYKAPGETLPGARMPLHTAAQVEDWLSLLGLLPAEVTT